MMKKYRINKNVERFFLCLWPIIFYDTFDKCNATERFSNLSSTQDFSMMECNDEIWCQYKVHLISMDGAHTPLTFVQNELQNIARCTTDPWIDTKT